MLILQLFPGCVTILFDIIGDSRNDVENPPQKRFHLQTHVVLQVTIF